VNPLLSRALDLLLMLSEDWDAVGLKGEGNGKGEQSVTITFRKKKVDAVPER